MKLIVILITFMCTSYAKIYYPTNVNDLKSIVREALQQKVPVTPVGCFHSVSPGLGAYYQDHYLVNMFKLNKILQIDHTNQTVKVEAGILLEDLLHELAKA